MRIRAITCVAVLLLLAAAPGEETGGLHVRRARLVLRGAPSGAPPRDMVKAHGTFETTRLGAGFFFVPRRDTVEVLLSGTPLFRSDPADPPPWKMKGTRWSAAVKAGAVVKLTLDYGTARFRLSARRVDLGALDLESGDLRITLRIAGETFFADLAGEMRGSRWRYRAPKGQGGTGNQDPTPPGPNPSQVAYRLLVDTHREAGDDFPMWENETVLRSRLAWIKTWDKYLRDWIPYPDIAEGSEMVLLFLCPGEVFPRFELHWTGGGLLVRYKTGYLPYTGPPRNYEAIRAVAVPYTPGPVTFERIPE